MSDIRDGSIHGHGATDSYAGAAELALAADKQGLSDLGTNTRISLKVLGPVAQVLSFGFTYQESKAVGLSSGVAAADAATAVLAGVAGTSYWSRSLPVAQLSSSEFKYR